MSAFKFSIERPIPIVATNPLPSTTPFLGLWAQQVHSPLLKRLGPKYFLQFFLKLLLRWGGAHQRGHFRSFFPLFLVTVLVVFAKVSSSQFPSRIARSHQISSRRTSHPHVIFSSKRSIFFIVLFTNGESLGTASNKQLDLMMNSGKLRITTHLWL